MKDYDKIQRNRQACSLHLRYNHILIFQYHGCEFRLSANQESRNQSGSFCDSHVFFIRVYSRVFAAQLTGC